MPLYALPRRGYWRTRVPWWSPRTLHSNCSHSWTLPLLRRRLPGRSMESCRVSWSWQGQRR